MVELCIFILGAAFSVILVPHAEARRLRFMGKIRLNLLMVEIQDIQQELERDARAYFLALLNVRTQADLASSGRVPLPAATLIDASLVSRLYEEAATLMTHEQRMTVKAIPSIVERIYQEALSAQEALTNQNTYCVTSVKNVIRMSASEAMRLRLLLMRKEKVISLDKDDYFKSAEETLKLLGFTEEQFVASRIRESKFHDVNILF